MDCKSFSRRCVLSLRNLDNHEVSCRRRIEKERQQLIKTHKQKRLDRISRVDTSAPPAEEDADVSPRESLPSTGERSKKYECLACDCQFDSLHRFLRHRESHYEKFPSIYTCETCKQQFTSRQRLEEHTAHHPGGSGLNDHTDSDSDEDNEEEFDVKKKLKCVDCSATFEHWHDLLNHRKQHRGGEAGHGAPWDVDPEIRPPWVEIDDDGNETIDTAFKAKYEEYHPTITAGHNIGQIWGIYNFPLNDFGGESEDLFHHLNYIFSQESKTFRINLAFGVILRNIETGEYRYYVPYYNSTVFDLPFRISTRSDLIQLFRNLESLDSMDLSLKTRESTKWQKVFISNVNYFVYRTKFAIGTPDGVTLPDYIINKRSIRCLRKNQNRRPYRDNLCVFRCLTWAEGGGRGANFENRVQGHYNEWADFLREQGRTDLPYSAKMYEGITFEDLPDLEECFNARVSVYSLNPDQSCTRLYSSSLEPGREVDTELYLNLYEKHFSLITNFSQYSSKYACRTCGRSFPFLNKLKLHERSCETRVKYTYPGGLYTPSLTIFEEMFQNLGLRVEKELEFYSYFAVYDFESVLKKIPDPEGLDEETNTRWTTENEPICVSVASNVPGYENPYCIIDRDSDNLVKLMCDRLELIQTEASKLAHQRWESVFRDLDALKSELPRGRYVPADEDPEAEEVEDPIEMILGGGDDFDQETVGKLHANRVESIYNKFNKYATVLPVLGYNSSRYDLNLIKKHLPKHLNLVTEADFIVKKANQYTAIATFRFKFLDISNYLAAGCSYSQFLKAHDVLESKSYLPYEWFDDVAKLDHPSLPPYEDFWSKLKHANVLAIEHASWVLNGSRGDPPKTGRENYQDLLDIWENRGMTKFSDFLEYYCNLDTGPFVEATSKLMEYYLSLNVDLFKIAISAPGISRRLLFQQAREDNIHFASFSNDQADLYQKIKKCCFGGPSIIFKRYEKVGETHIRNNPEKVCQSIKGWDANSMYLKALSLKLPILFPIRRSPENNFKPHVHWRQLESYQWMNYLMETENIHIQHKLNTGKEFAVGPYYMDGYSNINGVQTLYEFNGCFYHFHNPDECGFKRGRIMSEKTRMLLEKRAKHTREKESYIRSRGLELIVIYECQFAQMKKENPGLKRVIRDMLPEFYYDHPHPVSTEMILESVESGYLTGLLQVDIRVPEEWPVGKERDVSPQEYFGEFSPIFCNTDVEFESWGRKMQNYSMTTLSGQFTPTRRLLIGGMAAEKIFLSTDLLKWYLEKGLEVTKIWDVVEYKFKNCFGRFCDFVTNARRMSDADPSKDILGQMAKVLGNSAYGSLLLDKTKHVNVKYVHEKSKAHLAVNDPLFKKLTELPGELFEIEKAKRTISLDIPLSLSFCILNHAKKMLLQFYYDFLLEFVDKKDFELTHVDTDSMYLSLSQPDLESIIIPTKRREFEQSLHGHCNDYPFEADGEKFFPRECCDEHKQHDKREPGLFKLEASGTELIALASKTYFLRRPGGRHSIKAKGINKSALQDPYDMYRRALFEKKSSSVANVGFRAHSNTMMSYTQRRTGFTYLYIKREIQEDGISTLPLQIVLNPWEKLNVLVLNAQSDCLSIEYQALMEKHGKLFTCALQLFLYEKAVSNDCLQTAEEIVASKTQDGMYRAARNIKVQHAWYDQRDAVMEEILWQKILNMKFRIITELRLIGDKTVVQPGRPCMKYFTCGLIRGLAEITPPLQYPGDNALGQFWKNLVKDEEFMNSEV